MIPGFAQHTLSLLATPGQQGAIDGRAPLSAVRAACKNAETIGTLLLDANRVEVALIPPDPDFFGDNSWMAPRREMLWDTITRTSMLRWVVLTSHPENILSMPPPGGNFESSGNLCLGVVATGGPDGLEEKLDTLRSVPVPWRMLLLHSLWKHVDLRGKLDGIHWVVVSGNSDADHQASAIEKVCHETGAAFFFNRHGDEPGKDPAAILSGDEPSHPNHPFGPRILLRRPTLPDLEPMSATNAEPFPAPDTPEQTAEEPQKPVSPPAAETPESDIIPPAPDNDNAIVSDAHTDTADFERLDKLVRDGMAAFIEVGTALAEIHERKLWKAGGHDTWEGYCREKLGMSKPYVHRLVTASGIALELAESLPIGNDSPQILPATESQVRPLQRLGDPQQRLHAWEMAVGKAGGQPTAKAVSNAVSAMLPATAAKTTSSPAKAPPRSQSIGQILESLKKAVGKRKSWDEAERLVEELASLVLHFQT